LSDEAKESYTAKAARERGVKRQRLLDDFLEVEAQLGSVRAEIEREQSMGSPLKLSRCALTGV
jgi:hypothetical protein